MTLRLCATSDLHYGNKKAGDRATELLAAHLLAQEDLEVLVIVGDVARDEEALHRCLALFDSFPGIKAALPGNHDVWTTGWGTEESWRIHEELFPTVLAEHGFHPLHLRPLQIGEVALVGSMGWYDYSFRDLELDIDLACYASKTPPWRMSPLWNDARYAKFPYTDPELTALLDKRLQAQLAEVQSASEVFAFVHHCTVKALLIHPRDRVPMVWRFANTFLGARCFGETLEADGRVREAYCGHIHMERHASEGGVAHRAIGSDYVKKELVVTGDGQTRSRWFAPTATS